ncbi:MAG: HNH endonuclease [Oscillospiraceae bacterium]|nr:HNH endonuclease [Oscillospiraceae bacterium]
MSGLIDIFKEEKVCEYRGEIYSVRDNGAIMRHAREGLRRRPLDNTWTFGKLDASHGYTKISNEPVHRIVATAFLGEPPTKAHVVDHIDTNRQNNRPSNLRWLTRLENIVFNDITRKKLELLCGCSIDKILSDLSILKSIPLIPKFDWMKAVSEEEAAQSLASWRKWTQEVSARKEHDRQVVIDFNYQNGRNGMIYPYEPVDSDLSLEKYFDNLAVNETFCYKDYTSGRYSYSILDYCLNKETAVLSVATCSSDGVKSLFLTSITLHDNQFYYSTRSFFSPDGLEKYLTLAKGEEWTGGDVFDDYC